METDHLFWFLTRAAGFVAYLLLFTSVSLGLLLTGGLPERVQRFQTYDLHRFVALLAMGVTLFHVFIVLPDQFIAFSPVELLLPFASPYRPLYMTLGVFSLYVLAIVIASFYLRRLASYRVWRYLHFSTFGAFGLALLHGIGAGSDSGEVWAILLYGLTGVVVVGLSIRRAIVGEVRGLRRASLSHVGHVG